MAFDTSGDNAALVFKWGPILMNPVIKERFNAFVMDITPIIMGC
jgi:hypothetical protein